MQVQSAMMSGLQGFNAASDKISEASDNIAKMAARDQQTLENPVQNASPTDRDAATQLVDLTVGQRTAEANIKTIQTADQMMGTLIDEMV